MISPLTNEKKFGDVSTEDFTTLGVTVVQNSSDIANKPSSSQVDSQIDTKNAAQLQQINLDYADRPTTYNKSEVYTKTETDASLALKGSAAQLATVTAYANTLPTLSTVNNVLNARFLLQDGENFLTFGALSDTTANTAAIATATAATVTNQSGIAAVNANIANILTGSAALETLHVFNETVGGKNTLEIKNKPDNQNVASLQIEHELTASGAAGQGEFLGHIDPKFGQYLSSNRADAQLGRRCRHPHQHFRRRAHRCRHDGLHEPHLHGYRDYARWWWGICGGRSQGDAYMLQPA